MPSLCHFPLSNMGFPLRVGLSLLAILCLLFESVVTTAAAQPQRPNIVFILADDLGYMDIGANNPKTFYETPNIDGLARKGMRFTQGYAACPVCSPTRASIMTGKYPAPPRPTPSPPGRARPARR